MIWNENWRLDMTDVVDMGKGAEQKVCFLSGLGFCCFFGVGSAPTSSLLCHKAVLSDVFVVFLPSFFPSSLLLRSWFSRDSPHLKLLFEPSCGGSIRFSGTSSLSLSFSRGSLHLMPLFEPSCGGSIRWAKSLIIVCAPLLMLLLE